MSFFPAPYVGRFHHGRPRHWGPPSASWGNVNDIAPFFRVFENAMDSILSPNSTPWTGHEQGNNEANTVPTFQPRFDVKESEEQYELRGELPGVDAQNVDIKFADDQTLVIKGKTETEKTTGNATQFASVTEDKADKDNAITNDANDTASRRSSSASYVKPTVEDEPEDGNAANTASTAPSAEPQQSTEKQQETSHDPYHYWYSERSTGSFQRVFKFPSRVDQDGVVANLKNGVLDVIVPKHKIEEGRKIAVGGA